MANDASRPSSGEPAQQPEQEWPAHMAELPGCPQTEGASPVNCLVYRRVTGSDDDWRSYRERGKTSTKKKMCQLAALSSYIDLTEFRKILDVHESWPVLGIVVADLRPEHGVIKQTNGPHHYSLWLRRRFYENCAELFVAVPK